MIQDYVGSVIMLAEDQFRVGDVGDIGGASGEVVRMSLRATYLRDAAGKLYTVPNGSIRVISNVTRDWARALFDLTHEYRADTGKLEHALQAVADRQKGDLSVAE
jgi:small conductance mechanosensitive channel